MHVTVTPATDPDAIDCGRIGICGEAWSVDGGFAASRASLELLAGGLGVLATLLRECDGALVDGPDSSDVPPLKLVAQ